MPSIRALQETTTPITITHGSVTLTLHARLERIATGDDEYQKLLQAELELKTTGEQLAKEIQDEIAKVSALKVPDEPRFLTFRNVVFGHLTQIANATAVDSSRLQPEITAAFDTLKRFEDEIIPSDAEITEREEAVKKALKEIEVKLKAARDKLDRNRAERLVYLLDPVKGWDLTDGDEEGSPMWPITPENILTLSQPLRTQMLDDVEQAVFRGPF